MTMLARQELVFTLGDAKITVEAMLGDVNPQDEAAAIIKALAATLPETWMERADRTDSVT